ncbi:hypothetical protein NC797_12705 [Aquibacillus sp. 3ASR75-11]|uniref:Uncharacterized protein n=1 Tax=Terrihalobacillus insolitus TaxID=2950438 RepID=A0A9X4AMF5_9BACI|nr:hypothetical protein [Terrihalobacillus insolitus]MDC3414157.1 hypothetical protein [Terrihalobacillus insolitus]MDC3425362.1 hypothetical protein [Terrihalobacillus insolitus]
MNSKYIKHIKQVYPELSIEDFQPNDVGQNNDVLIIIELPTTYKRKFAFVEVGDSS